MNHKKIVADIVLIPPKEILELAITLNKGFPDTAKEDYILNAEKCIPHITLMMGIISRDQLEEITSKLAKVADKFTALNLKATELKSSPHPDGKIFSTLEIERSPELQNFHETIMKELAPFFSWDHVENEMFYSPPPVREISSFWVEGFRKNSSGENYNPHISLGFAQLSKQFTPKQFISSKLALCHLGNYCTCRDILWSTELK